MEQSQARLVHRNAQFDAFEFDLLAGRLRRDDRELKLGSRAAALLRILLENAGTDVGKAEISDAVWPGITVEDVNIRVQISAIRKALGDQGKQSRYISNVSGLGYRWIAPTRFVSDGELEARASTLVGRAGDIERLWDLVEAERLVTIVGTGGIGKTSVAREVGQIWTERNGSGAVFVDFATIADPALTGDAIRSALGAPNVAADAVVSVIAALGAERRLILLDNCEHVMEAARGAAERILEHCEGVHILATSREVSNLPMECIFALDPLDFPRPGDGGGTDTESLIARSAVELFVRRMNLDPSARLEHRLLLRIASICRQLDGVPLAIELVARQAGGRDIEAIARDLAEELSQARAPRAGPRHQSLRAAIDWSYRLLSPEDQRVLRAVSTFRSAFSAADAAAIVGEMDSAALERLVAKSILARSDAGFRLLETMRDFAASKADELGEQAADRFAHARHLLSLFPDPPDWEAPPGLEWAGRIDDLRAALDWLIAGAADRQAGCALLACSAPLWLANYLFFEYRDRIEAVLDAGDANGDHALPLAAAFAVISFSTGGQIPKVIAMAERALALADAAASPTYALRARWALVGGSIMAGNYRGALAHARRYAETARSMDDPALAITGQRMLARAHNYIGDQRAAQTHAEAALTAVPKASSRNIFLMDHRIMALGNLARILWCRGFSDRALALADEMVEEAVALGHAPTTCLAVAENGCNITLWSGDRMGAQRSITLLRETADRYAFPRWQDWVNRFEEAYDLTDPDRLEDPVVRRYWAPPTLFHAFHAAALHPSLVTPEALGAVERDDAIWCAADILRGTAEQIMGVTPDVPALAQAEAMLTRAAAIAETQGALGFELRAALSLNRLRRLQGRERDGREAVARILNRFTEGFGTIDVRRAQAIVG